MSWPAFMVYESGLEARWLRMSADGPCPGLYKIYHHAMVRIEDGPFTKGQQIEGTDAFYHAQLDVTPFLDDERWPTKCDYCDYVFSDDDTKPALNGSRYKESIWTDTIYRADDGRTWPGRYLPAGAMFNAPWRKSFPSVSPDGLQLAIILPPGGILNSWGIDSQSSSGGFWTREGVPPMITASPSIKSSSYHGFLQNGVLTDCLADMAEALAKATPEFEAQSRKELQND